MTTAKQRCAEQALAYLKEGMILGVGTGTTSNFFIQGLAPWRTRLEAVVASSETTAQKLRALNMPLVELNHVNGIDLYVDGADEINEHLQMIKGGGGAATREKILASASKQFICIAELKKSVTLLGKFPIAVEVLPMARSFVAREIVKLGGHPDYRVGFKTDQGNVVLDCYDLDCTDFLGLEHALNNIPGVVGNGVFAARRADLWVHE